MILGANGDSINRSMVAVVKRCVLFAVRAEYYLDELRLQRANE